MYQASQLESQGNLHSFLLANDFWILTCLFSIADSNTTTSSSNNDVYEDFKSMDDNDEGKFPFDLMYYIHSTDLTWFLQNGDVNPSQAMRRTTPRTMVSNSFWLHNTITFWFTLDDAESIKMEVSSNSDSNDNIDNDSDINNHDDSGKTW